MKWFKKISALFLLVCVVGCQVKSPNTGNEVVKSARLNGVLLTSESEVFVAYESEQYELTKEDKKIIIESILDNKEICRTRHVVYTQEENPYQLTIDGHDFFLFRNAILWDYDKTKEDGMACLYETYSLANQVAKLMGQEENMLLYEPEDFVSKKEEMNESDDLMIAEQQKALVDEYNLAVDLYLNKHADKYWFLKQPIKAENYEDLVVLDKQEKSILVGTSLGNGMYFSYLAKNGFSRYGIFAKVDEMTKKNPAYSGYYEGIKEPLDALMLFQTLAFQPDEIVECEELTEEEMKKLGLPLSEHAWGKNIIIKGEKIQSVQQLLDWIQPAFTSVLGNSRIIKGHIEDRFVMKNGELYIDLSKYYNHLVGTIYYDYIVNVTLEGTDIIHVYIPCGFEQERYTFVKEFVFKKIGNQYYIDKDPIYDDYLGYVD